MDGSGRTDGQLRASTTNAVHVLEHALEPGPAICAPVKPSFPSTSASRPGRNQRASSPSGTHRAGHAVPASRVSAHDRVEPARPGSGPRRSPAGGTRARRRGGLARPAAPPCDVDESCRRRPRRARATQACDGLGTRKPCRQHADFGALRTAPRRVRARRARARSWAPAH